DYSVSDVTSGGAWWGRECISYPPRPRLSDTRDAVEQLPQLAQAERLAQHRALRAQQVVARLRRYRVAAREDDAALAAPPFDPQLLKQVEAAVRFVEVHVHDQRVVARGRLGQLPPRVVVPRHAGDLVAQP